MAKNIYYASSASRNELYMVTYNSPRVKGKLVPKTNPMSICRVTKLGSAKQSMMGNIGDAYYYTQIPKLVKDRCNAYNKAFNRFKDLAWNGSQVQTAVSLAESREALEMVASLAGRLVKGARLIRKGKFAAAARHFQLGEIPHGASKSRQFLDNWMAYRYGWAPTVSDLYSHADAIANPPKSSFVIARGRDSWPKKTIATSTQSSGTARVVIKARVVVSNPVLARLNQFGVLNPLEVAWELVPLSFVVDWFAGIGDYLSNISAFVGLSLTDCSQTYAFKSTVYVFNDSAYTHEVSGKSRVVSNILSNPPFMLGSGLNPKRAMDSLAILQHIIRGR